MTEGGLPPIETVSAGGVVLNQLGQILVVRQGSDIWSLPKGHVEAGEDLLSTARREIHEESGLHHLQPLRELGRYQRYKPFSSRYMRPELKNIAMFLFYSPQLDLKPIDPANPEARWMSKEEVISILSFPEDRDFFLSIINLIECFTRTSGSLQTLHPPY
jgi:8-oxo-dGTP pyrophosphatase MutT (NUDIX family)